jgi:glycosyltransferase involved in cell wall biosynthesis
MCINPKVSVLMPAYNREQYIGKALDSVLLQTHDCWECIVYDDGSTDNTVKVVEEYALDNSKIRLIVGRKNYGVAHARNMLLDACTSDTAVWLDSDDIMSHSRIETQLKYFNNNVVFSGWYRFQDEQELGAMVLERSSRCSKDKAFASVMFPVDKTFRFDESFNVSGEDWNWLQRLLLVYPEVVIKDILYFIRVHDDRIGSWKRKFKEVFSEDFIKNHTYSELVAKYKEGK